LLGNEAGRVRAVQFKDGREIPADLVVMAAGIRPNTQLAESTGLLCQRGLVVSDTMQTVTDPRIYAVGECAAHRGIAYGLVARANPDGYTLLLGYDGTMVINPHVFEKISFNTEKDFVPVGKIGDAILILVAHPSLPAKTVREVIALSKAQPGGLSYGTSGTGGTPHIAGELLNQRTGSKLVHIPYKGGGQALIDVLGGSIPLVYTAVAGSLQHIKGGKLNAIAVSSAQRSSSLPDVPTFIESGIADFQISSWVGILAPAKTPRPIVDKLNTELNAVLNDPDTRARLETLGIAATPGTPAAYGEQIGGNQSGRLKTKILIWRGFPDTFALKGAPMLDSCHFLLWSTPRESQPSTTAGSSRVKVWRAVSSLARMPIGRVN
ncbi:MAG: tripartite tricarboxylate transporter substrate-binding protein, partial [Usitatibacteraceae bacterium]